MLNIRGTAELQATVLLLRQADAATRRAIAQESRAWAPELVRAIQSHARTPVDRIIAGTARTTSTARGLRAVVGSSGRLPSGEPIRNVVRPFEFGTARPNQYQEYLGRSPKGRAVRFDRRTQRQVPRINPQGRFVYAGVADATPALVARYVRAVAQAVTHG